MAARRAELTKLRTTKLRTVISCRETQRKKLRTVISWQRLNLSTLNASTPAEFQRSAVLMGSFQ